MSQYHYSRNLKNDKLQIIALSFLAVTYLLDTLDHQVANSGFQDLAK